MPHGTTSRTHHKIVVIGGESGGISVPARLRSDLRAGAREQSSSSLREPGAAPCTKCLGSQ